MVWFAHLERHCSVFQSLQKTNLLTIDFLATWHLDQYNRYNCCQQNYAVNMLSWWTESSLASHNNFGTYPDSSCGQFTARSSELIRLLLMLIKLHTVCRCLKFVAIHACCLCWFSAHLNYYRSIRTVQANDLTIVRALCGSQNSNR